jgi:cardiolipin synthase (CMP-forming)
MITSLPNLLTLSRIAVVPLVVASFFMEGDWPRWVACWVFVAAAITDWFDGHLARTRNQVSSFGRVLDPIADKLLVGSTLFMLSSFDRIGVANVLPALIILMREILVSGLREFLAELRVSMPVTRLAKWKTGFQMVALPVLLVGDAGPDFLATKTIGLVCLWIAAVLTIITGWDYLRAGIRAVREEEQ